MKTPMQELIEQLKQQIENQVQFRTEFEDGVVQGLEEALDLAKDMLKKEKEVAHQYAEFAVLCYKSELPVLEFDGWVNF